MLLWALLGVLSTYSAPKHIQKGSQKEVNKGYKNTLIIGSLTNVENVISTTIYYVSDLANTLKSFNFETRLGC